MGGMNLTKAIQYDTILEVCPIVLHKEEQVHFFTIRHPIPKWRRVRRRGGDPQDRTHNGLGSRSPR
jgi:hypothetical protein